MEANVRAIVKGELLLITEFSAFVMLLSILRRLTLNFTDGLVWGGSSLVAVGFGIKKLQINLVVEDDKISLEELQQDIEGDEDHVQSTDVSRNPIIPRLSAR